MYGIFAYIYHKEISTLNVGVYIYTWIWWERIQLAASKKHDEVK